MYVVILILLSVAVGVTFWRKWKSKSSQGKLAIWREVIGDWTRPWRELPRNMKTALAFFLALWFFTWVNERLQLIPSINNFNSWASKIYFLLLCVVCLYFLKASWAYRGRHMQRGQSPAINSQSQQTDNHKAKQYPYAWLKSGQLGDVTCKKCGAKVSEQYGYCTNCLSPFDVESGSDTDSKPHNIVTDWLQAPIDPKRPSKRKSPWFGEKCIGHRETPEYPNHVCTCGYAVFHRGPHYCQAAECPFPNRSWPWT